jgi:hypothetical protein
LVAFIVSAASGINVPNPRAGMGMALGGIFIFKVIFYCF